MSFTTITLTGAYLTPSGSAAAGKVTFQLEESLYQLGVGIVADDPITVTLNGSGQFSQTLVATDDTGTLPAGKGYKVTEAITGAPANIYRVRLPHTAAGATIDIASCPRIT
jgi:hypothetical protein